MRNGYNRVFILQHVYKLTLSKETTTWEKLLVCSAIFFYLHLPLLFCHVKRRHQDLFHLALLDPLEYLCRKMGSCIWHDSVLNSSAHVCSNYEDGWVDQKFHAQLMDHPSLQKIYQTGEKCLNLSSVPVDRKMLQSVWCLRLLWYITLSNCGKNFFKLSFY